MSASGRRVAGAGRSAELRVLFATAVEEQLVRLNPVTGIRVTRPAALDESGEEAPKGEDAHGR